MLRHLRGRLSAEEIKGNAALANMLLRAISSDFGGTADMLGMTVDELQFLVHQAQLALGAAPPAKASVNAERPNQDVSGAGSSRVELAKDEDTRAALRSLKLTDRQRKVIVALVGASRPNGHGRKVGRNPTPMHLSEADLNGTLPQLASIGPFPNGRRLLMHNRHEIILDPEAVQLAEMHRAADEQSRRRQGDLRQPMAIPQPPKHLTAEDGGSLSPRQKRYLTACYAAWEKDGPFVNHVRAGMDAGFSEQESRDLADMIAKRQPPLLTIERDARGIEDCAATVTAEGREFAREIAEMLPKALAAKRLKSAMVVPASDADPVYDYSGMDWHKPLLPELKHVGREEINGCRVDVLLLTATPVEREQVLRLFHPLPRHTKVLQVSIKSQTYYVGRFGAFKAALTMCAMGSVAADAAGHTARSAIELWKPAALIMVGIAFGASREKHRPGDVLVAQQIIPYEGQRVGKKKSFRSAISPPGLTLLDRFRNSVGWQFQRPDGTAVTVHSGQVLSGEKLIDNPKFKLELLKEFPEAIGGEMEGAGMVAAATLHKTEWILIKGVVDWADGSKSKTYQKMGAAAASSLAHFVLLNRSALHGLHRTRRSSKLVTAGRKRRPKKDTHFTHPALVPLYNIYIHFQHVVDMWDRWEHLPIDDRVTEWVADVEGQLDDLYLSIVHSLGPKSLPNKMRAALASAIGSARKVIDPSVTEEKVAAKVEEFVSRYEEFAKCASDSGIPLFPGPSQ